ncbi:terpene synthase family protein [Amycolatopsis mongoliensis]|uniref:Terpene synthase family protein n=1 Tax=Amycolatopsis mongoliensis TaxID=715475 RepID=A0A9Y2JQK4_9PSEU|nr:terpene synthase family protein [Amycolatopsis sp. 4-36]WIY01174.1 terpene synthase family protein [Amycolatopsis sp. 4-36]
MAELFFPFPVHAEIGCEEYDRKAGDWLSRHSDLPPARLEAVVRSRAAALVAFTVSPTRPELVELASAWTAAYLLVDDVLESAPIEEAAVMAACGQRIWDDPSSPAPSTAITAMVRQIARETLALATPAQRQRLRVAHQRYFAAAVTERLLDAAERPPSAEVHTGVREQASGLAAMSAVVEFAMGMDIPEHEYHSAPVRSFFQAAHLAIAWINDIGAFAKDAKEGHHNVVAVLAARSGLNSLEATNEAVALLGSVHYALSELSRLLLREGSPPLRAYVESMVRHLGAFTPWLLHSPRYSGMLADEPFTTTGNAPDGVEAVPDIAAIAWWWNHLPARTVA